MSRVRCFWLEPTDEVQIRLRRFVFSENAKCSLAMGYHDADVVIGRDHEANVSDVHGDVWPHADPRWPRACGCGYEFSEKDEWQFNPDALFRRSDSGELTPLYLAGVGAMWDAYWMRGNGYKVVDGITLCVRTPGGDWCVDGPSYSGGKVSGPGWTRTGTVPDVTATPSILVPGKYHGWLRAGWLEAC